MRGIVTNIQRMSIHDGPGIRTTVFLKGCPLRCEWCDNPETWYPYPEIFFYETKCRECGECVRACPIEAVTLDKKSKINRRQCTLCMKCVEACKYGAITKVGEEMTPEEVVGVVEKDVLFYRRSGGGITLSGGEPLFQPDFAAKIFKLSKQKLIHTTLDTSGLAEPDDVREVVKYTDLVLLDIKHMDSRRHEEKTGAPNRKILENAQLMAEMTEVRTGIPLIPGFNDSVENITKTANFAKSLGIKAMDLLPIHKIGAQKYKFLGLKSPYDCYEKILDDKFNELKKVVMSYGLEVARDRAF